MAKERSSVISCIFRPVSRKQIFLRSWEVRHIGEETQSGVMILLRGVLPTAQPVVSIL